MMEIMAQAMACMYNTQNGPSQKSSGMKPTGGKPYLGKSRPSEVAKGLDGKPTLALCAIIVKILGTSLINVVSCSIKSGEYHWQQKYHCGACFKQEGLLKGSQMGVQSPRAQYPIWRVVRELKQKCYR